MGYLAITATWAKAPSRDDVSALLREMAAAVEGGQTDGVWEGEGYHCSWLAQLTGSHGHGLPDTRS